MSHCGGGEYHFILAVFKHYVAYFKDGTEMYTGEEFCSLIYSGLQTSSVKFSGITHGQILMCIKFSNLLVIGGFYVNYW